MNARDIFPAISVFGIFSILFSLLFLLLPFSLFEVKERYEMRAREKKMYCFPIFRESFTKVVVFFSSLLQQMSPLCIESLKNNHRQQNAKKDDRKKAHTNDSDQHLFSNKSKIQLDELEKSKKKHTAHNSNNAMDLV